MEHFRPNNALRDRPTISSLRVYLNPLLHCMLIGRR
jgi:hypothetical protein